MTKNAPAPEVLRCLLSYEPESGAFIKGGKDLPARISADGYRRIYVCGVRLYAHRIAWAIAYGAWPTGVVDHINGNKSDNRLSNLRDVTSRVNLQNERRARRSNGSSHLIGAHWSKRWKRWKSSIGIGGKAHHLGWFGTAEEAHEAYVIAKRRLHAGCTI